MSNRKINVSVSSDVSMHRIRPGDIADLFDAEPTDEQIENAIRDDVDGFARTNLAAVASYDRPGAIAMVRAAYAARLAEDNVTP